MPAVKRKQSRRNRQAPRRRVMPKTLRRGLRYGAGAVAVILLVAGGTWAVAGGGAARVAESVTQAALEASASMGLRVENVLVTGRNRVSRAEAAAALRAQRDMPILGFDPHAARQRLEALPWVRSATVERRLPDTIYLHLTERRALALWQSDSKLALIDADGVVVAREHLGRYAHLPMVVGKDAAEHAATIIGILRTSPIVQEHVSAIIRISGRRWNLQLRNGVVAELPEDGAARAVSQLAELIARDHVLERNVTAIDMRLPDRLVVRTAPGTDKESALRRHNGNRVPKDRDTREDT